MLTGDIKIRLVECANSLFFQKKLINRFLKLLARREVRHCEHKWRRIYLLYLRLWLSLARF